MEIREKAEYDYIKTYVLYQSRAPGIPPSWSKLPSATARSCTEPAKYVAKLRTLKTDSHVLILQTNMDAGHGGSSGRYDQLRETAFDYAFILDQLGIKK